MFIWYIPREEARGSLAEAIAGELVMSMGDAFIVVDEEDWTDNFRRDLARCQGKNPSVIKTRYYELYHSSNHKVYAYFPPTGKRRIYG